MEARLLLLARRPVMSREYPSMNPWMTIPQRIRPATVEYMSVMYRAEVKMALTMLAIVMPQTVRPRNTVSSTRDADPLEDPRDGVDAPERQPYAFPRDSVAFLCEAALQ